MSEQLFIKQYSQLPEAIKQELAAFMEYLLFKYQHQSKKTPTDGNGNNEPLRQKKSPKAGFLKGSFIMSSDFDEPLEDFKEYMI